MHLSSAYLWILSSSEYRRPKGSWRGIAQMTESRIMETGETIYRSDLKELQEQSTEDTQEQSVGTHANHSLEWRRDEPETQSSDKVAQFCEYTQAGVQALGG